MVLTVLMVKTVMMVLEESQVKLDYKAYKERKEI